MHCDLDDLYQRWYRDTESDDETESAAASDSDEPGNGADEGADPADGVAQPDPETSNGQDPALDGANGGVVDEQTDEGDNEAAGSEEAEGSTNDTDEAEETRPDTPATVLEDVVPLTVDLLRFAATKADTEVIEAHEGVLTHSEQGPVEQR